MRTRRGKIEQAVEEGEAGRRGRGRAARPHRRIPLRLPDRDHDGLDRDRVPRRALAGEAARAALRRPLPRRRRRRSRWRSPSPSSPPSTSRSASRCRRCWRSPTPTEPRGGSRGRSAGSPLATAPITKALSWVSNGVVRLFGVDPKDLEEHHTSEDLKQIIDSSRMGGTLDPGEAGMLGGVFHLHEQEAREVMTPIPAVVTVDASETVEAALRRCVTSGHTRLVVIEDDNPDRVKGVVHNNSLARLYMSEGPRRRARHRHPRRPDRPRDAPARRPPARPAGAAHLALGRRRRVRAHGRDRHRRGHPRGGGGGDRGRDRPPRRRPAQAHQRRLVRPRPRLARRPRRRRDRAAGRHRRLQLGRRLRLRRARPAAEARRLDRRQRLHDPGRGGAREPDRGGADQRRQRDSVRTAA